MSAVLLREEKVREKVVENRKQLGFRRSEVVVQLQLLGLDMTYDMYKKFENGRRGLTAIEFLFLSKILNIDAGAMVSAI